MIGERDQILQVRRRCPRCGELMEAGSRIRWEAVRGAGYEHASQDRIVAVHNPDC